MVYNYAPEINERFNEVLKYHNTDFQRAVDGYAKIIKDYAHDDGVLAKAYYLSASAYSLMSKEADAEMCCAKSIECGKKSGNVRCQILSMIQSTVLKLNHMNDGLAANYIYDALELAIQNQDDDLLHTIYTLLGQVHEATEDYSVAYQYYRKGIEEFVKLFPDADTTQVTTYGARILCSSICNIYLKDTDAFEANYKELERINFAETLPVYEATMIFMKGHLAYMKGEKEAAVSILLEFVGKMPQIKDIMDTYELLTHVYNVFEAYGELEHQKKVLDLMAHYANTIDIWKCRSQYNSLKIRYYKKVNNRDILFEAFDEYYELQQQYHNSFMEQRKDNLLLRKQVFEEMENTKSKIQTLENLSETDMLTGVANRNGLTKYVERMMPIAVSEQKEWGVVLIDIDRYKGYNDHYGHIQGDMCLKRLSEVFKRVVEDQFCARYGGDEFICVFMGKTKEEVIGYMERLQRGIAELHMEHIKNEPYGIVTISQGAVVRIPQSGEEFESFVYEADTKLYQCKGKGRNNIVY